MNKISSTSTLAPEVIVHDSQSSGTNTMHESTTAQNWKITIMTDSLSKYQYLNLWFAGISILVVRKKVPSLSLFRNSPSVTLILRLPLPSQGTREKAANKKRRNGSGRS